MTTASFSALVGPTARSIAAVRNEHCQPPTFISLRDYFAAKAMHALITEPPWGDGGDATIHTWSAGFHGKDPLARFAYASYKMADAMLAMREYNADPSERAPG